MTYPEHEKLRAARTELSTEHIGAFLDWMWEQKIQLSRWEGFDGVPCPYTGTPKADVPRDDEGCCAGCGLGPINGKNAKLPFVHAWVEPPCHGYQPLHTSTEALLAEYAGIDLKKIDAEKRAMLDALRKESP